MAKPEREVTGFFWASAAYTLVAGAKSYELSNHLGNVMAVISDRGELQSAQDFYPFGMSMPGRSTEAKHRYGFNGKETDPETGLNDFGARLYDNRLGRWLAVDPLAKKYPAFAPYSFVNNMPIIAIDPDGNDIIIQIKNKRGGIDRLYYCDGNLYVCAKSSDGKCESFKPYIGTDAFALAVQKDLNQLSKDDPILAERIKDLAVSVNPHSIVQEVDESFNHPTSKELDSKGIPTGSTTHYDEKSRQGPESEREPRCALAHELLGHGWESDQGKTPQGKTENGIRLEEVHAVNIENIARAAAGNVKRTHYTVDEIALPIPKELLKKPEK